MSARPSAGIGYSEAMDSFEAGAAAAREALDQAGLANCSLVILFSTCHHDPVALRAGVVSVVGEKARLVGGWSVGAASNQSIGYGGYQVGLACLDLAPETFRIVNAGAIADREQEAGSELGAKLGAAGIGARDCALLFYDSINRLSGRMKLNMATPLLAGLKEALPGLPRLAGAGLAGDMGGSPSYQWIDSDIVQQTAFSVAFTGDIRMHCTMLRGVMPVGGYHRVTRAEGSTILEIDGRRAVDVVSELLGKTREPTGFGFHVMLGYNHGDLWAPFDEDQYTNVLCLRADLKRGGLVMFEPRFQEGSLFQLMSRTNDFAYIGEKIGRLFAEAEGETPFFALYINCAGRAGAYAGTDEEDVIHVQREIGGRVPLLALYSGCEIGTIAGEARAMDWTGILCLFTQVKEETGSGGV